MFPRRAVSSVTGIGGMAGSIGGIVFQPMVTQLWTVTRQGNKTLSYNLIFLICGLATS